MSARRFCAAVAAIALVAGLASGCAARRPLPDGFAEAGDALALSDKLEAMIAEGRDTPAIREAAYEEIDRFKERTPAYYFARAAIIGRYVQQRGLRVANLVRDVEYAASKSIRLDPDFREGAAKRLLGTLYVFAPAALMRHGNSEKGLQILEDLTEQHPDTLENHLRLAEAYISLGDPDPACPHLCRCVAAKSSLRPDDQQLLDRLLVDLQPLACCPVAVEAAEPPPPPPPPVKKKKTSAGRASRAKGSKAPPAAR